MIDYNVFTNEEAYAVGKKQRTIVWAFFFLLVSIIFPPVSLIISIIIIFFVYELAKAEKKKTPGLWAFAMLIPLVKLICLLILIQDATKILRAKGLKIGLMGANKKDLENLLPNKDEKPITNQSSEPRLRRDR